MAGLLLKNTVAPALPGALDAVLAADA